MSGPYATYGISGPAPAPLNPLTENFSMRDIAFRSDSSSFSYATPVQEAQNRFASATANSPPPATTTSIAQAPGALQRPVAMSSMQVQLLRQLEAGPSNQSRQEGVRHSATTSSPTLSITELNQVNRLNQVLLAEFRQKADADPDNTPLTKDYCCDVLVELANWLKQQSAYHRMHSLLDLVGYACDDNHLHNHFTARNLEKNFIASGAAPVHMGKPNPLGPIVVIDLGHIIEALNLSRHKPRITLPPAFASRQDERWQHAFRLVLLGQSKNRKTAGNNISAFRHFCKWLHQQTALGKSIPHGLDSLEKLLNHPNENEVKEVMNSFKNTPGTTKAIGKQAHTAVIKFWNWRWQPPAPATSGLRAQPTLQQQLPARPEQPANLTPPHNSSLSGPAFMAEVPAFLSTVFDEEGGGQHGARRPALWPQDEPRAVRPRLNPEQPANRALAHSSSLTEPAITDEEIAFLAESAISDEELVFFNKIFK